MSPAANDPATINPMCPLGVVSRCPDSSRSPLHWVVHAIVGPNSMKVDADASLWPAGVPVSSELGRAPCTSLPYSSRSSVEPPMACRPSGHRARYRCPLINSASTAESPVDDSYRVGAPAASNARTVPG